MPEDNSYELSTRIEVAIEKLTEICSDLNKMIAVHEQRINTHDKQLDYFAETLEARRQENEFKLKDVYNTIKEEDRNVLAALEKMREEFNDNYGKLNNKIGLIEKKLWTYMGGFSVLMFMITYGKPYVEAFFK